MAVPGLIPALVINLNSNTSVNMTASQLKTATEQIPKTTNANSVQRSGQKFYSSDSVRQTAPTRATGIVLY
jgi:hypothetical protein